MTIPLILPQDIRNAVLVADTYQEAAEALGMPYSELYRAAKKLGVVPVRAATKAGRKAEARALAQAPAPVAPPVDPLEPRPPPPEPEPVRLTAWEEPPPPSIGRPDALAVRRDQHGRVRVALLGLGSGWVAWALYDSTGGHVGKFGLRGSLREAEQGADRHVTEYGWMGAGEQAHGAMAGAESALVTLEHWSWLRGFAAALGAVMRLHDQPGIVRSVMDGDGVTVADLTKAGVDAFDLDQIRRALPSPAGGT